jgi:uncharacterized protein
MTSATLDRPLSLAEQQFAFASHIRNPHSHPAPHDVEPRRMAIYRELFFNNIDSFLASGFPVLKNILPETQWTAMVQGFFANHKSTTPYFAEIAEEFLSFLHKERAPQPHDPLFLLELAHYEWVELALSMAEGEAPTRDPRFLNDPLSHPVMLSELVWPLAYRFPVHRIAPDFQPNEAPEQPTYLTVFRDDEDEVRFMEINAVTYRLLQLIEEKPKVAACELMLQIAAELDHPNPSVVMEGGATTLSELAMRGVIASAGARTGSGPS